MKFAQQLSELVVPEWKVYYLDYKQGKKKLKGIVKLDDGSVKLVAVLEEALVQALPHRQRWDVAPLPDDTPSLAAGAPLLPGGAPLLSGNVTPLADTVTSLPSHESELLHRYSWAELEHGGAHAARPATPDPLEEYHPSLRRNQLIMQNINEGLPMKRFVSGTSRKLVQFATYTDADTSHQSVPGEAGSESLRLLNFPEQPETSASLFRNRAYTLAQTLRRNTFFGAELKEVQRIKAMGEFRLWLDGEFSKIDAFYRKKEDENLLRFMVLQNQLYQLREQKERIKQFVEEHDGLPNLAGNISNFTHKTLGMFDRQVNRFERPSVPWPKHWRKEAPANGGTQSPELPLEVVAGAQLAPAQQSLQAEWVRVQQQAHENALLQDVESPIVGLHSDYVVRKPKVPYLVARRQIKTAIFEYYRALELLKLYRAINRTACRKMVKKFDKTTGSKHLPVFMDRVNLLHFLTLEVLDTLFLRVEDLYALYFASGNHKQAVEMLRARGLQETHYRLLFTAGLLIGVLVPLLVFAAVKGGQEVTRHTYPEAQFLMQIWGGFLLVTLMAVLVAVNVLVWEQFKVNYKFIFEFRFRDTLDALQYLLIPLVLLALVLLLAWFSLNNLFPHRFPGRDWPWMFVGVFLVIFLWPFNQLYYSSRRWFQVALWRLFFSGFYPVEFRDFFLGDIFCLLTYSILNLSFFICLYATHWHGVVGPENGGSRCGLLRLRVLGFLSALPLVWRFLQCWRRYCDSGATFPHLANMAKYAVGCVYQALLSVYRIDRTEAHRAGFITIATINLGYTIFWDLFMDWLFLQANLEHFLLRNHLAFKRPAYYYAAMAVNVVLRFQWIFYALFSNQIQQLAITLFAIAVAEVVRRFIWLFFRMENEHCTNVEYLRALRETPLPYPVVEPKPFLDSAAHEAPGEQPPAPGDEESAVESIHSVHAPLAVLFASGVSHPASAHGHPTLTRKPSMFVRLSERLGMAHRLDFERRRVQPGAAEGNDSDEDDDDDD